MSLCDQYLPDLCAWIDGELEDSQALEAHLATCASCRARVEEYRKLNAMIAAVEPPATLHQHIMQGVNNAHSPKAKRRFAFGSATAVAAAAAVLVLAIGSGWISLPHFGQGNAKPAAALSSGMQYNDAALPSLSPTGDNSAYREARADSAVPMGTDADMPAANTINDAEAAEPAAVEDLPAEKYVDVDSPSEFTEATSANFSIAHNSPTPDVSYGIVVNGSDAAQADALSEDASQLLLWYIYDYQPGSLPEDFAQRFAFHPAEGGGYCADTDFDTLTTAYSDYYNLLGGDLYGKARVEAAEGETDQIILMPKYALTLSPSAEPASYWIIEGYAPEELPESFANLDFAYTSTGFGQDYLWVAQISVTHFRLMVAAQDYDQVGGYLFDTMENHAENCYIILLPPGGWTEQLVWTLHDVNLPDLPDEILANCTFWDSQEDEECWSAAMDATMLFGLYLRYGGQLGGELVSSSESGENGIGVLTLYP